MPRLVVLRVLPVPEPSGDVPAVWPRLKVGHRDETGERKPDQEALQALLTANHLVHYAGIPYAVPGRTPIPDYDPAAHEALYGVPGVAVAFGPQLKRRIVRVAMAAKGIPPLTSAMADNVILQLEADAFTGPPTRLGLRFYRVPHSPSGEEIYLDLGRSDGLCVRIAAGEVQILPHAPQGVVFRRSSATRELPVPVIGQATLGELAEPLAMDPDSDEYKLGLGWMLGLPFEGYTRPGLLLTGPPGTGKSTRLRMLASIWEPSDVSSLGSSFGRKDDDDQVRALHRAVPLWDNITAVRGATSDLICQIITGTALEGRKLFYNSALDTNPIMRPIGLTAVGVPAGLGPDALDRLIHIEVPPLDRRIEDSALQATFDHAHPRLLGAACWAVAVALGWRTRVQPLDKYRMAGHAHTLAALDAAVQTGGLPGCPGDLLGAYDKMQRDIRRSVVSEDVFGSGLLQMLGSQPGRTWTGTASELLSEVGKHRWFHSYPGYPGDHGGPGWPKGPRSVPTRLAALHAGLRDLGVEWTHVLSHGRTLHTLTLSGDYYQREHK